MRLKIRKLIAKPISYGAVRNRRNVRYIVIHYTGNSGDTARGNCYYFAHSNTRYAGAHFFVSRKTNGEVWKSVPMCRPAWSVGGDQRSGDGGGIYYGKCTNYNSVSIELCDIASKDPSKEQIETCRLLIKYIQKHCPNAKTIIRHWDVNGKQCPARLTGKHNSKWILFKRMVVSKSVSKLRSKPRLKVTLRAATKKTNQRIASEVVAGKWGNGEDRKARLKAAGYNYRKIQKIVNELLK